MILQRSPHPRQLHQLNRYASQRNPALTFSPLAWLKLQMFLHAGDTEVGGFGISAEKNLLYVQEFMTLDQKTSSVTVEFADDAVANHFDRCVDSGLRPARFARIWCHTHPGSSPEPSLLDEQTFARVFGDCDWSVMFILGRTGKAYARLNFSAGPGGSKRLPVRVDWAAWPKIVLDDQLRLAELFEQWSWEFGQNIHPHQPVMSDSVDQVQSALDVDWWQALDEQVAKASLSPADPSALAGGGL